MTFECFPATVVRFCLSVVSCLASIGFLSAADWPHWRGPEQNGVSRETTLPDRWSPDGENLLWRKPEYATRSTPIVMDGRLYTICRANPETNREGEKVICVNAETGDLIWEAFNNVFLSDAPAERVGWSSVVGDPRTGNVYSLGLGCYFQCLEGKTGKVVWSHSMSEEYGMLSTYGGRTNFPVVFEDLVIISGVMTGWGEYAVPAHRFVAFDKLTGEAVWMMSTRVRPEDTTYSTPIITRFAGQSAMVFGAADGSVYAIEPRTGRVIWKYDASTRGINTTPLVVGDSVSCGHSEQNATDTTTLGALFALNGRVKGEIKESDLLWKVPARTVGRCQPMHIAGRIYAVDDGGAMWIIDAQTGKEIGRKKLGRIMFGSMVAGDGKIYVGEATGRWYVLKPSEKGVDVVHDLRLNGEEILGSPIIANGRIYLPTLMAMYCIGSKERATASTIPATPIRPVSQTSSVGNEKIEHIQIVPVESLLKPAQKQKFTVRGYDHNGEFVRNVDAELSLNGSGTIDRAGNYVAGKDSGHAVVLVNAKAGDLTSTARVRVIPPFPWSFDMSDKKVPPTWIGASYRHQPREVDGESVLVKITTIPKGTRSQAWMGPTDLHDYTIQADLMATERDNKRPDMGLINQRYALEMKSEGDTPMLQIRSWTSRLELRFAKTIPFPWNAGIWYTMKFRAENKDGKAVLSGKVWPRDQAEPADWMITAADATPNVTGSPGLFGNASFAEFFIDNVKVNAN
jgi:outer membrane protein assembly factor BamB